MNEATTTLTRAETVIGSIIDALRRGGIPFAERWSALDAAIDLLRKDFADEAP